MKKILTILIAVSSFVADTSAFCGFYVAKAGAELFNNRSQVIFVRDGNRSVITMSNDYNGSASEFAMVIPVPEVIDREDIRIANQVLFDKFDSYSGPRLVEYYDENPCEPRILYEVAVANTSRRGRVKRKSMPMEAEEDYHVQIEASYTVGEYDIVILSAAESDGLKRWLTDNGYSIPAQAERVLEPYIKNNLKFFVVKVNTNVKDLLGFTNLRPLQIEFESEKFMLPIRLGMANSKGAQDMIIYAFTKGGRIESANYRTIPIPSNRDIPTFLKGDKFQQFYVDLFNKSYHKAGKNTVFTEYAWDVSPGFGGVKCDPCVGPPPIVEDLKQVGVWWVNDNNYSSVFFTRLHVRYAEEDFPQDLFFLETSDRSRFQGRYVMHHPATGDLSCDAGVKYKENLTNRRTKELSELAALTDWNVSKYTKYVSDGSGRIDEKAGRMIKDGNQKKNDSSKGNAWPMGLLLGSILLFILSNLIYDLRKEFFS